MNIKVPLWWFEFSNVRFGLLMCNFNIHNLKTQSVNSYFIV